MLHNDSPRAGLLRILPGILAVGLLTAVGFDAAGITPAKASAAETGAQKAVPEKDGPEYDSPKKAPPALPTEFAFTFALPYGQADEYPRDQEEFERMMLLLKQSGFNTIYCPYTKWRHQLFKKHGMKMMVDVLAWKPPVETDIRRNDQQRAKVKAICEACRGSQAIWGYNLWNERLDWCGGFSRLDLWLRMLRTWDPTHPVWVGTYRHYYSEHYPTFPGVVAWYDYYWSRGFSWNFRLLSFYRRIAQKRKSVMGKWLGINDYNRDLYAVNTAVAHGVKVVIWFIGGPYSAREPDTSKRWHQEMHLIRVGQRMQPLYGLIGKLGLPDAVYSTPTQRTADNQDKQKKSIPADTTPFPDDFWLQFPQGEVLAGLFRLPDDSRVAYICNHNAWAWQGVVMKVAQNPAQPKRVDRFDRRQGSWVAVGVTKEVNFALPPGDAQVYRFQEVSPATDRVQPPTQSHPDTATDYRPEEHWQHFGEILFQATELPERQQPKAVYSNSKLSAAQPFPKDFWMQVKQGELVCGFYKLTDGSQAVVLANLSPTAWQGGVVTLQEPKTTKKPSQMIWQWSQENKTWTKLGTWQDLNFPVPPGEAVLFKFTTQGASAESPRLSSPQEGSARRDA